MNLKLQRRMAAKILKCGESRVWMDPSNLDKIKNAITKNDIRKLINEKIIKKVSEKKSKRTETKKKLKQKRKGRRKGEGSRKGSFYARVGKKELWMKQVRAQRRLLKKLRDEKKLKEGVYRKVYRMIKGGMFRSKKHLLLFLKQNEMFESKK